MARNGENIYKRKDGRWEGRYVRERTDGKVKYGTVYAKSYRDVRERLDEVRKELEKPAPPAKAGKVTDVSAQWLSEASLTLKQSSVNKYEDILRCYILPEFGELELSEISNQRIIDFANCLLLHGGARRQGLTPATVTEVLSTMNGIRVYALKRDCAVTFSPECVSLKREQKDIRVFSLEEELQLVRYLLDNMNLTSLGILLSLFTGIRVGELCALNWDDISLPEKKLSVSRTVQRIRVGAKPDSRTEVQMLEPKTASSVRTIPLPEAILDVLEEFHTPGAFLLTGDSSRYIEPRTMQNRFKRLLRACDIPDANFHAIRHTFATRCIELGFDAKSLSEILGHSSIAVTMNRYVHPTMELKAENMNRLSKLFAGG